jgi:succinylglutamate desuccinylase
MLRIFQQPPAGLWDRNAHDLVDILGGPALIHLPGEHPQPLFIATLLHGNEPTGWQAICRLMQTQGERPLPRAMALFIGNVHAAREGLRHLDDQADYNRIWRDHDGVESGLATQVLAAAAQLRPVACIDVHNTSGVNPVYGCIHDLDDASGGLAQHFAETVVLVQQPDSLLSMALSSLAPSITLECGKPGNPATTQWISDRLQALLAESDISARMQRAHDKVLRAVARVRVPDHVNFSFTDARAELCLSAELEQHNFRTIPGGTVIASIRSGSEGALEALDDSKTDVTERYFRQQQGKLVTAREIMLSMFTTNERIVRQDCLCYLMEPVRP